MEEIYSDTGYWLALFVPRDPLRDHALRAEELLPASIRMVTSDLVIVEVLNALSRERHELKREAILHFSALREDSSHTIIPSWRELIERAESLYVNSLDKYWSLTDCASFIIMRDRNIHTALTHDRHFTQAGFRALLRET